MANFLNNNTPLISVIVITYNRYNSLKEAIEAILKQTFHDFELVIVDDASEDGTKNIIESFSGTRIKYLKNVRNLGIAKSRNIGLDIARGRFIFFTDDDCSPYQNWLEEGIKILQKEKDALVIQGFVVPEKVESSRVFRRTMSDNWMNNMGNFMCANMAFPKDALMKLRGFDLRFNRAYEDVDLGLRARKIGKVIFSRQMLVKHRHLPYNKSAIFAEAGRAQEQVRIIKYHPEDWDYHRVYSSALKLGLLKVLYPTQFFYCLTFPFYVIAKFIWGRYYRCLNSLKLFPFLCIYILIQRFFVWRASFKEKIFII